MIFYLYLQIQNVMDKFQWKLVFYNPFHLIAMLWQIITN
jgi:hypothetical protein